MYPHLASLDEPEDPVEVTSAASSTSTDSPEFKAWFGKSVVVDAEGKPLVVYRGEHGSFSPDEDLTTRLASLSFGSNPDTAGLYATEPNDMRDNPEAPRVYPVYLRIENPFINDPDDPFVDLSHVEATLGAEAMKEIALAYADHIYNTGAWEELVDEEGFLSIQDAIDTDPEKLRSLCLEAYILLDGKDDGARFVDLIKSKGYDGAVHAGFGDNLDDVEYKVFSLSQVKSVFNKGPYAEGSRISESLITEDRFLDAEPFPLRVHGGTFSADIPTDGGTYEIVGGLMPVPLVLPAMASEIGEDPQDFTRQALEGLPEGTDARGLVMFSFNIVTPQGVTLYGNEERKDPLLVPHTLRIFATAYAFLRRVQAHIPAMLVATYDSRTRSALYSRLIRTATEGYTVKAEYAVGRVRFMYVSKGE